MSGGDDVVWWKGRRFDARTRDQLEEAERLSGLNLAATQGSYVGVIVRPETEALAVAAGAAIGALGTALANEAQFRRRVTNSIPDEDAAFEEVLDDRPDPGGPEA